MGLLKKSDSSVSKKYEPTPSIKKYNYRQYLESQSKPSEAILNTASKYSDKAASSAALQIQLESETKKRNPSERKRRSFCGFGRVWFQLLALLQVLGAVAVIAITAGCIDKNIDASLTNNTNATSVSTNALCYTVNSSVNTCTYIYWSSGISIILSVLLALWNMCCAGKRGKCCVSMEAFIALLGCAWWIAAGTVAVIASNNADKDGLGEKSCRTGLWITCYITAGLFGLCFLTSSFGCCCRCCRDYSDDDYA